MSLHFNALSGLTQTCLTAYLTQYLHRSRHFTRLCISVHSWEVYLRFHGFTVAPTVTLPIRTVKLTVILPGDRIIVTVLTKL